MVDENIPQDEVEPSFLDKIKAERVLLEKATEESAKILKYMQELRATEILSGRADAGQSQKKEETPKEYRDRILRGL